MADYPVYDGAGNVLIAAANTSGYDESNNPVKQADIADFLTEDEVNTLIEAALADVGGGDVITLRSSLFDFTDTTAVSLGSTPDDGRHYALTRVIIVMTEEDSASAFDSATFGIGVTGAGYNESLFAFLPNAGWADVGDIFAWNIPAGAVAVKMYNPNTEVFAKMGAGVTGTTCNGYVIAVLVPVEPE